MQDKLQLEEQQCKQKLQDLFFFKKKQQTKRSFINFVLNNCLSFQISQFESIKQNQSKMHIIQKEMYQSQKNKAHQYFLQRIKQNNLKCKGVIKKILSKSSWPSKIMTKHQLNNITIQLCLLAKSVNSFLKQLVKLQKAQGQSMKKEFDQFNQYYEKLIPIAMTGLQISKENYRQKGEQYLKLYQDLSRQILKVKEIKKQCQSLSTQSEKIWNIFNLQIRVKKLIESQLLNIQNFIIFQKNELNEENQKQNLIKMKIKCFLQEFLETNNLVLQLMDSLKTIFENQFFQNLKKIDVESKQRKYYSNFEDEKTYFIKELKQINETTQQMKQPFGSLFGQNFCQKTKNMLKLFQQRQELKYQQIWKQVLDELIN